MVVVEEQRRRDNDSMNNVGHEIRDDEQVWSSTVSASAKRAAKKMSRNNITENVKWKLLFQVAAPYANIKETRWNRK